MTVILHVEPKTPPLSWQEFISKAPPNSVALDGYVFGPPEFDPKGPFANFHHHELVNRLATRATCGQVLMAIRQGFFSTFIETREHPLHLYVNDCDEDVCTSVFLLRHGFLAKNVHHPILNKLVFMEDAQDTCAGAYPHSPDEKMAWVFEPYRTFRLSGGADRKNADAFRSIITDVESRIMQYVVGNAGTVEIDTSYEILDQGKGWVMVKEIGSHARTGIFADGHQAFVSVRERPDGRWTYTIGKMAFAKLDLNLLYQAFNDMEDLVGDVDKWGGAGTIGGSPRVNGSRLTPDEIVRVLSNYLQ